MTSYCLLLSSVKAGVYFASEGAAGPERKALYNFISQQAFCLVEELDEVRMRLRSFFVEVCLQTKQRLPVNFKVLQEAEVLEPANIFGRHTPPQKS